MGWFPAGARDFSIHCIINTNSGLHWASYSADTSSKVTGTWSWLLTSSKCQASERVYLYIHFPIFLYGLCRNTSVYTVASWQDNQILLFWQMFRALVILILNSYQPGDKWESMFRLWENLRALLHWIMLTYITVSHCPYIHAVTSLPLFWLTVSE